jgi:regulation of enolase protein 1 (concanavalin A-like superfamily)
LECLKTLSPHMVDWIAYSVKGERRMSGKVLFKDDFSQAPAEGWSWVREDPSAWEVADGALRVRTLPGTLWGERNNAVNVITRSAPEAAEYATEAIVTKLPEENGEQAGLLWYLDDANNIKLVKEMVGGRLVIVMAREEQDQPGVVGEVPFEPATAQLRLALDGGRVTGHYRASDEEDWQPVGECEPVEGAGVGLCTHGSVPDDEERWAQFERFRVLALG